MLLLCRRVVLILLTSVSMVFPGVVWAKGEAVVFIYHRFSQPNLPLTNISLADFEAQLKILRRENFEVVGLGDIVRDLQSGKLSAGHRVALSVDDAFTSFKTGAWPLLQRYRMPVTLFVNSGSVGTSGYLNWDDLRLLAGQGVEIGNHTVSHPHLVNRLEGEDETTWLARVRAEIVEAQAELERQLGRPVHLFAYPYGEYEPKLQQLLQELGYPAAFAQHSGVIDATSDRYALPRFPMGGDYTDPEEFRQKALMHRLPITVGGEVSPVLGKHGTTPDLVIDLAPGVVDASLLRGFVSGKPADIVLPDPEVKNRFVIRGGGLVTSRRTKYTLTAPGLKGGWYWFSQLWIDPRQPE